MMETRTIFLSHSHKDIDKVRTIRNLLESIDYEPLLFYLKCLDDNNDRLEEFIEKEIESRNIFIYCKSSNSEKSVWVQKELEYIRAFDAKIVTFVPSVLSTLTFQPSSALAPPLANALNFMAGFDG